MDQKLFDWINSLAGKNEKIDQFMVFASNNFRYIYAFILLFLTVTSRTGKKLVSQSIISVVMNMGINILINNVKVRPRPFLTRDAKILLPSKYDSTYVSKHTLLTFAVSTIVFMYHKALGKLMLFMSFLTGISRIWVGAHYPFDILRSFVIGSIVSFFVHKTTYLKE